MIGKSLEELIGNETTTIITANQRLAAYLKKEYDKYQFKSGKKAWESLDSVALNTWTKRLFSWCETDLFLLSNHQLKFLWQQLISRESKNNPLLDVEATASISLQAWEMINLWQINLEEIDPNDNNDHKTFLRWATKFKNFCDTNSWLDQNNLQNYLAEESIQFNSMLPRKIILAGFDSLPPATINLLQNIIQYSTISSLIIDTEEPETEQKLTFSHSEDEIRSMASWARTKLTENPNIHIGCIGVDLANNRSQYERIFTEELSSPSARAKFETDQLPFDFSLGQPLAELPLIKTALNILEIDFSSRPIRDFSFFIKSPHIGGAETEFYSRAMLDAKIHQANQSSVNPKLALAINNHAIEQDDYAASPELQSILSKGLSFRKSLPAEQSPSNWARSIKKLLKIYGWPGERTLSSLEFQQNQKFHELLNQLSTIEAVKLKMSLKECLDQIKQLASSTIFQAKKPSTPIQVLGPLEAVGIKFDAIWISGLDDSKWPTNSNPNPYLPYKMQRDKQLPRASAKQESYFSKKLLRHFTTSAKNIIYSYSLLNDDQPQLPSPLIERVENYDIEDIIKLSPTWAEQIHNTHSTEIFTENPNIVAFKKTKAPGGVSLFKHQAECPFRAFATLRLKANTIHHPTVGIEPRERGTILHQALSFLWAEIKDQKKLKSLPKNDIEAIIDRSITRTFENFRQQNQFLIQILNIEKTRLKNLLKQWLEIEKDRSYFKVVGNEQSKQLKIKDLEIKLQVDRIDQIDDGSHWIIDYKTGKPDMRAWFGDRPTEPQLPLYCLSHKEPVSGLLFAQLRSNEVELKGCVQTAEPSKNLKTLAEIKTPDAKDTWNEQVNSWRTVFDGLADDFKNGHAAIAPKDPPKTCQFCDLKTFCRIDNL